MSTDVRDRLKQAALEPSEPLDVAAVYQRGRRLRRFRQTTVTLGLVALIASAGLLVPRMVTTPVPFVGSQGSQSQFLADDWVSFREYRIAAGETADCLRDHGVSAEVALDEASGRLTFGPAQRQSAFDDCYRQYFADIDRAWVAKVGLDTDGVSWAEYRQAVQATIACLTDDGWEAEATLPDHNLLPAYGFELRRTPEVAGVDAEKALSDCERSAGLTRIQLQWADQITTAPDEDQWFYELITQCLEARGVDMDDRDALSAAARDHPTVYDECRQQAEQEYRPYG